MPYSATFHPIITPCWCGTYSTGRGYGPHSTLGGGGPGHPCHHS